MHFLCISKVMQYPRVGICWKVNTYAMRKELVLISQILIFPKYENFVDVSVHLPWEFIYQILLRERVFAVVLFTLFQTHRKLTCTHSFSLIFPLSTSSYTYTHSHIIEILKTCTVLFASLFLVLFLWYLK